MLATEQISSQLAPSRADEARGLFERVKKNLEECKFILLDIQRRELWRDLGYENFAVAIKAEFGDSQSTAYRQLASAVVDECLGESLAEFGKIPTGEAEILKRLAPDSEAIKEALGRADEIAENKNRRQRSVADVLQAVEEIQSPQWADSKSFAVNLEGRTYYTKYEVEYPGGAARNIRFLFRGEKDSISADGYYEHPLEGREIKALKNWKTPQEWAKNRLQELYGLWQIAVNTKTKLNKDFPAGTFVKVTKNLPGCTGDVGKVCKVIGGTYDGLCIQCPGWTENAIFPLGYFEATDPPEDESAIASPVVEAAIAQEEDDDEPDTAIEKLQESLQVSEKLLLERDLEVQQLKNKLEIAQATKPQPKPELEEQLAELKQQLQAKDAQIEQLNALNQQLQEKDAQIERLQAELATKEEQSAPPSEEALKGLLEEVVTATGYTNHVQIATARKVLNLFIKRLID